ncbi:MAG TPA: rhodanese-like domain-containing protein [Tissierellia bacterium]|jgi:rhodanese-related sulfurtransferase|nr:rhodanese-like domain-containing protein [Tissierellia bacterium]
MFKFKKLLSVLLILAIVLTGCAAPASNQPAPAQEEQPASELAELPPAQKVEGDYSFENSGINHENLLDYLNRPDSVYIDLRNYEDYAKKHFKNFEVIPFFAYIYNENAGTEGFPQLFKGTHDEPIPVYESSEAILNALFPKDKNLMLMCQSGGRVAMLMKMLAAHGYDMSKVYNVGGMAQYTGEQYREFITDTEELNVEVNYIINAY